MVFQMSVRIQGDAAKPNWAARVNRALDNYGHEIIKDVAFRTQMGIKFRAPAYTGKLRKSISVKPESKYRMLISVGEGLKRPYHWYQETGYRPHWVSKRLHPEVEAIGRGAKAVFVSKYTPYIAPTMERVPSYINRAVHAHWKRMRNKI